MSKSKLKAIKPIEAKPSKPKILIYGKPGVGKTWASLDFPSVYYIDTEGGADLPRYTQKLQKSGGGYLGLEQGSLSFDVIIEQLQALATEDHPYQTVIIDSISKVFNNAILDEAQRLGDKNQFGADKKPAILYMKKLISWINRLDMNVILIAHEKSEWGTDPKGNRVEIGSTFDCWDKLEYELHLALNIVRSAETRKAFVRKSRLEGFPDRTHFDWGYAGFAEKYGKDVLERNAQKLVLATPEQLTLLKQLMEVVKIPDDQVEKWLLKANAESFEEMDSSKIEAIISFLQSKLPTLQKKEVKDAVPA